MPSRDGTLGRVPHPAASRRAGGAGEIGRCLLSRSRQPESQRRNHTSNISVQSSKDGRLEAFVRGTDSAIYNRWQTGPAGDRSGAMATSGAT